MGAKRKKKKATTRRQTASKQRQSVQQKNDNDTKIKQSASPANTIGVCGLKNLKNTCFLNSVLQCLLQTRQMVRKYTASLNILLESDKPQKILEGSISSSLRDLFVKVWIGNEKIVSPISLLKEIAKKATHYRDMDQQDAHEFLRYLLDAMSTEALRIHKKIMSLGPDSEKYIHRQDDNVIVEDKKTSTFIDTTFMGTLESTIVCRACKNISVTTEPFMDLSLPIPANQEVKKRYVSRNFSPKDEDLARSEDENLGSEEESSIDIENDGSPGQNRASQIELLYENKDLTSQSLDITGCLTGFTAPEVLENNEKFGCMECTKRDLLAKDEDITALILQHGSSEEIERLKKAQGLSEETSKGYEKVDLIKQPALKQIEILKAPGTLTIHLKRFRQKGRRMAKDDTKIAFPETLDLSDFMAKSSGNSCNYKLYGIVSHAGTLHTGHYVAYTLSGDKWYYFSDTIVRETNLEVVLKSEAYLLFYEKSE